MRKGGAHSLDCEEKFSMTDLLFVKRTLEGKKGVKNGVKAPGRLINNIHITYTNLVPPMFAGTVLGCVWRRIKTSR